MPNTIAIACDHGGTELKGILVADLQEAGVDVVDLSTHTTESVDYPDYGYAVADALKTGDAERGILICGSGIGISMAANRFSNVRAATVHDVTSARLCREHNDANVICLGARLIGPELARECVQVFLNTEFEGGRHEERVDKLSNPPV